MDRGSWWCKDCRISSGGNFDKNNPYITCVKCGEQILGVDIKKIYWFCPVPLCKYGIQFSWAGNQLSDIKRGHYFQHLRYFSLNVGMYNEFRWRKRK